MDYTSSSNVLVLQLLNMQCEISIPAQSCYVIADRLNNSCLALVICGHYTLRPVTIKGTKVRPISYNLYFCSFVFSDMSKRGNFERSVSLPAATSPFKLTVHADKHRNLLPVNKGAESTPAELHS